MSLRAQKRCGSTDLAIHNLGAKTGWFGNVTSSIVQDPVWTHKENVTLSGFRTPDRQEGSESLHRLSYAGRRY